jgi:hypothetical protein
VAVSDPVQYIDVFLLLSLEAVGLILENITVYAEQMERKVECPPRIWDILISEAGQVTNDPH